MGLPARFDCWVCAERIKTIRETQRAKGAKGWTGRETRGRNAEIRGGAVELQEGPQEGRSPPESRGQWSSYLSGLADLFLPVPDFDAVVRGGRRT